MTTHAGLPVAGYQPQADDRVQLVNRNKEAEERLLRICDELRAMPSLDQRFVSIAVTHFQEGFMALNRAIFQPQTSVQIRQRLPGDTAAGKGRNEEKADMREETMFNDKCDVPICVGDVVRMATTGNVELHGAWCEYRIRKAPGGYVFSYLRSENGQILPEGYTGGYMADSLPDEDEHDLKTLVFTLKPIRVNGWQMMPASQ